jgi:hypothetical protein
MFQLKKDKNVFGDVNPFHYCGLPPVPWPAEHKVTLL